MKSDNLSSHFDSPTASMLCKQNKIAFAVGITTVDEIKIAHILYIFVKMCTHLLYYTYRRLVLSATRYSQLFQYVFGIRYVFTWL